MNDYVIREIKQKEIVDGIKVLWQAFGRRTTSEGINQDENLWNKLINEKIAKFFVAIKDKLIIGVGGLFLFKKIAAVGYFGVLPEPEDCDQIGTKLP